MAEKIRGINILNPVDIDRDYYLKAISFAIENNYNHIQLNGPIHNFKRSNVDGMVMYKKYSRFNYEKDEKYIDYCMNVVNECLVKSHAAGIKTYMWHHELEVPTDFMKTFPEILNDSGDVEITHPLIKDFVENKFKDFFEAYPLMDGIVITFYETKIPLLRLKNQKLGQQERMEYVTRILYEACKKFGKDLIVRLDATLEEDYIILLDTYEKVSTDLIIMDKWTQYDWSLTLPNNQFIHNVKKSPLLIETDIFGEYFGKGRLPLMLKNHITEKFVFCEQFNPIGYCSRIDRGGYNCFGQANEVNLYIMQALIDGKNLETVIDKFFFDKYGAQGQSIKDIMEQTEDVVRKTLFANGYYYSELSLFPTLNHCKNHFYFEQMKQGGVIASDEWFVPKGYIIGDLKYIFKDLSEAKEEAQKLSDKVLSLKGKIENEKYDDLFVKFKNLELTTKCWYELASVFYYYVQCFESDKKENEKNLYSALDRLSEYNNQGKEILGDKFYCLFAEIADEKGKQEDRIAIFIEEVKKSFVYEKTLTDKFIESNLTDFVVCGGACESHKLKKEVNFSDTLFIDDEIVRIPGNRNGLEWSLINAHGWFSYEMKIKENAENKVRVTVGSKTGRINFKITIGEQEYVVDQPNNGKNVLELKYLSGAGENKTRVQIDKISGHTPCVYSIEIL